MVSCSMTQVGKWSRRLVGGALVFALAGLSAPAPTSARFAQDETPIEAPGEDIYIVDTAPSPTPQPTISPYDTGTHTGASAPNSDPSGGGSESGGGLFDGYGYVGDSERFTRDEVHNMTYWCSLHPDEDRDFCTNAQAISHCQESMGGIFYFIEELELDANGNEVSSRVVGRCDILSQYGWMQVWYHDLDNGSAEPTEVCSGEPGKPGTCFEP